MRRFSYALTVWNPVRFLYCPNFDDVKSQGYQSTRT
nr:MAG TPA: hypothetical protein [Caudoviricetes sp.]